MAGGFILVQACARASRSVGVGREVRGEWALGRHSRPLRCAAGGMIGEGYSREVDLAGACQMRTRGAVDMSAVHRLRWHCGTVEHRMFGAYCIGRS
ncbi:hypothetical protein BU23DRAFT_560544 [Bimuria novae-zelandiae CBS 107.79]|uniref:Uncharacterized protein n=1 Tax=Bimuria novae-zelandiae CBS 107.79 TaxID=1447943 RepID=A0A6A5UN38_9PLEO|nr:hypothetical protein BU23DRAFT_560544 [Bimuria novae-zelandiae CBS 107.79]